jgi:hypothetical protein
MSESKTDDVTKKQQKIRYGPRYEVHVPCQILLADEVKGDLLAQCTRKCWECKEFLVHRIVSSFLCILYPPVQQFFNISEALRSRLLVLYLCRSVVSTFDPHFRHSFYHCDCVYCVYQKSGRK